jgi:flagellar biogenesis protein FliO
VEDIRFILVLLVLAMAGGCWLLQKLRPGMFRLQWQLRGQAGTARVLEITETLHLGPQHRLHVIRYRDEELLLAASQTGCSLLSASSKSKETSC